MSGDGYFKTGEQQAKFMKSYKSSEKLEGHPEEKAINSREEDDEEEEDVVQINPNISSDKRRCSYSNLRCSWKVRSCRSISR